MVRGDWNHIVWACCEGAGQAHATFQRNIVEHNMLHMFLATLYQHVGWRFEIANPTSAHAPAQQCCFFFFYFIFLFNQLLDTTYNNKNNNNYNNYKIVDNDKTNDKKKKLPRSKYFPTYTILTIKRTMLTTRKKQLQH